MSVKHGLGRGIESLLADYDNSAFEIEKLEESGIKVQDIPIDSIRTNPNQPRKIFDQDALNELASSIATQGIIQPIIVEQIADGKFSIIAGERRYRAAKIAGLKVLPCIVRTYSDVQRMEVSLIENIQRENLNPVEEAKAYSYLIKESGIKQEDLAGRVGKSRPAISNSLRLLNLPEHMLLSLQKGEFSSGHARALLSIENPSEREMLYNSIIKNGISVRQAEQIASDYNSGRRAVNSGAAKGVGSDKPDDIQAVEEKFYSASSCNVEIKGSVNKGKIVIPYGSFDELERIYQYFAPKGKIFDDDEEYEEVKF